MTKPRQKREASAHRAAEQDPDVQAALEGLTEEQAETFLAALELVLKKRRIMLLGYLMAITALIAGGVWAVYVYATHTPGTFIGWVVFVPLALCGAILWGAGRYAKHITK